MRYTPVQIAQVCANAGFRGQGLTRAVAVVLAESGGDPAAVNVNKDATRSRDRGLFQINSRWHPEVTDAQAFSPLENAKAAYRISNGGKDWSAWTTWKTGAAQAQLGRARLAAAQVKTPVAAGAQSADFVLPGPDLPLPGPDIRPPFDPFGLDDDGGGMIEGIPDPGDLTDSLGSTAGALGTAVGLVVKTGAWMADPHNWLRVAMVTGGTVGVLLALGMIARSGAAGDTARGVTKTAGDAVTMAASGGAGAVAKAGKAATAAKAVT